MKNKKEKQIVKVTGRPNTKEEAIQYIRYYCKKQKLECIWIEDEAGINCKLEVRRKQNTVRKKMTVEQRQEMKYCDFFKLIKKAESKIEKMEEKEKEDAEYM